MNMYERFEQFQDDFLKFELIENKKSNRPDLHAFLLLDEIFPDDDIVSAAEHDEIWLDVVGEDLELREITDDVIHQLVCCGVMYDYDTDSLHMFA